LTPRESLSVARQVDSRQLAVVMVVLVLSGIFSRFFLSEYLLFSQSDSLENHVFWKVAKPDQTARWQHVMLRPALTDPIIPDPGKITLFKKAACMEGETVRRDGLHFYCIAQDGFQYDLGMTKQITKDGRRLTPWLFERGRSAREIVPAGHVFVVGRPAPESYDSRYFGPVPKERICGYIKPLL